MNHHFRNIHIHRIEPIGRRTARELAKSIPLTPPRPQSLAQLLGAKP